MGGRVSFSDRVSTAQSENFIKVKIIEWKLKFILCRVLQNNGTVRACCERIFEPRSVLTISLLTAGLKNVQLQACQHLRTFF